MTIQFGDSDSDLLNDGENKRRDKARLFLVAHDKILKSHGCIWKLSSCLGKVEMSPWIEIAGIL